MEVIQNKPIFDSVNSSLSKSLTYPNYRELVKILVENNSTSGLDKTEANINYTMLNNKRMKRWDKTIKVSDEAKRRLANFSGQVTWLVITESWCGDAAHVVPAINKIAELHNGIDLKLVLRDENEVLMNQFLTNGARAIPKLIMIDKATKEIVSTFGPRPSIATKLVQDYKVEHGVLTPEFKEDLQRWYNADKGQATIEDLLQLLGV
ncbi:thioredoxin family protein [Hanstruepera marina]|uniref:thioredoxin family protein n=1 Tax=Hanstruepera marina TaxID=2873265 RepID=UPI001CA6FF04|nr:thioredoxin family protein [Hanstruepera marina]